MNNKGGHLERVICVEFGTENLRCLERNRKKTTRKFLDLQASSEDFSVPGHTKLTPFKMGSTEQTILYILRLFCMLASAS